MLTAITAMLIYDIIVAWCLLGWLPSRMVKYQFAREFPYDSFDDPLWWLACTLSTVFGPMGALGALAVVLLFRKELGIGWKW